MKDCLFCKIIARTIPAKVIFEDEYVLAFPDIHPIKPTHLLIIPKEHVTEFVRVEDANLFQHIGKAVQQLIKENGLVDKGYKIIINGGGAQDVDHLHFHLVGPMGNNH